MIGIRKSLLQLIFSGSYMKRWNDKLRFLDLYEVDKQAHKMMVAWLLYTLNAKRLPPGERLALGERIVEGGLFDYFYRLVITDIKPPIFYRIKANPAHYKQLTDWVLTRLEPTLRDLGPDFWKRLVDWYAAGADPDPLDPARRILDVAHVYASTFEFNLIRKLNPWDEELDEIEASFKQVMDRHSDLIGVRELAAGIFHDDRNALARFAHLCGRLRFQTRWSQTPRVPETSVLGHLQVVAAYCYCLSMSVGACPARRLNDFFCGLFHDLPELLTRDIISPVKQSVSSVTSLVHEYENRELTRLVLDPLREGGYPDVANRLSYLLGLEVGSEFKETVIIDGSTRLVSGEQLQTSYNEDRFDPKDGELLKTCDSLAAFIEAYTSLRNGMTSDNLVQAIWRLRGKYNNVVLFGRLHVGALLADFD